MRDFNFIVLMLNLWGGRDPRGGSNTYIGIGERKIYYYYYYYYYCNNYYHQYYYGYYYYC